MDDCILAAEPRGNNTQVGTFKWPSPRIAESVAGKIRLRNYTCKPQQLRRNDHVCQILNTCLPSVTDETLEIPEKHRSQVHLSFTLTLSSLILSKFLVTKRVKSYKSY